MNPLEVLFVRVISFFGSIDDIKTSPMNQREEARMTYFAAILADVYKNAERRDPEKKVSGNES